MELEQADKNSLLDGKFSYKKLPDGSVDKNAVVCKYCNKEFAYHRSTSSLRYHLNAKHVDASVEGRANLAAANVSPASTSKQGRQPTLDQMTGFRVKVLESLDDFKEEPDEDQKGPAGPSSVVSTSSVSLVESRPTNQQEAGVPSKRKREAPREPEMTGCQQNVSEELNKLRDENELFLLSLLPSLKRLTIKKRMEVRMKFQQVLYEAEFDN